MPRFISAARSAYIRRGGVASCEVTDGGQYSADLPQVKLNSLNKQTQQGGTDYGLFAIAEATSLGYGEDPAKSTFQQENLREHLLNVWSQGT